MQSMVSRAKPVHKRPLEPKDEYCVTTDGTRYHIRHPTGFMTENSAHRGPSTGHTVKYTQGLCACITIEKYNSEIAQLTSTLRPVEINTIKSASEARCFHSRCPMAEMFKRQRRTCDETIKAVTLTQRYVCSVLEQQTIRTHRATSKHSYPGNNTQCLLTRLGGDCFFAIPYKALQGRD